MQGFRAYILDPLLYQLPVGAHVCLACLHPVAPQCEFPLSQAVVWVPTPTPRHCEWMRWGEAASTEMPWEQAIRGGGWQLSANDTCFLAVAPLILTIGVLFCVLPLLWGIWEIWVLGVTVHVPGRGPIQLLWGQNFLFFFSQSECLHGRF